MIDLLQLGVQYMYGKINFDFASKSHLKSKGYEPQASECKAP